MEMHKNIALNCRSFLGKYYARKAKEVEVEVARLETIIMSLLQSKTVKVSLGMEEPQEVFALLEATCSK